MEYTSTYPMKRGNVLVTVNGFYGEEDFYLMHRAALEVLSPDNAGYSVDSMCIGGYLEKDGILLRTSSECPYDTCCFFYNADALDAQQLSSVKTWIEQIVGKMHKMKGI